MKTYKIFKNGKIEVITGLQLISDNYNKCIIITDKNEKEIYSIVRNQKLNKLLS